MLVVLSVPSCAVKRAQDHDGLLELDEVDASKAVATSSRAAMDPADDLRHSVPDRTGPVTRVIPETWMRLPVRRCAFRCGRL